MQGILRTPWPHDTAPGDLFLHGQRAAALRNSLRPGPSLTTGNLSLQSRIKHSPLPESLGTVGIPSKVQALLFLEAKMVETYQLTDQAPLPTLGTCSSSHSLAPHSWLHLPCSGLLAAAKTFCSLSALGGTARDRSFFCHPCCKPPKPKPILFGLPCGHRMDLLPTKSWEHRLPQKLLCCLPVFISFLFEGGKAITWREVCSLHRRCCKVTVAL